MRNLLRTGVRPSALLVLVACAAIGACRSREAEAPQAAQAASASAVQPGGQLVVSVRGEPQSFNGFVKRDVSTALVTLLTQAPLVRVNRATGDLEPWLAESWTRSEDGLQYTVKLRPNVTFADGHPLRSDDVVFSLAAAYDEKNGSVIGDTLAVAGRHLVPTALDPLTVVITFPTPFGPGLRLLDNLVILPKHKLAAALSDGTFGRVWATGVPPGQMTGLGPFVLAEYAPGQRMVFTRNPRYFRKDLAGRPLPYLDRITADIVPEQDAEILRLQSGDLDMTSSEIRPEDYAPLLRSSGAGKISLLDLGPALDPESLWFNLNPAGFAGDPRASWIQRDELRQAISLAVDRQKFADTVYLGAAVPAFGPVTASNTKWYSTTLPRPASDPARAKALLASIGLLDRNGDGLVEDARGAPARFTVLTQKGQTALERGCVVLRDELKKIGLTVDVVPLERNAVIQKFLAGAGYDAVYFHVGTTDTDPAVNPDFWLSSGTAHVWNLMQKTPATPWERRIDELMAQQIASADEAERKRVFDEVQRIFAEHAPIVYFAAPKVFAAASARVMNLTPAVLRPQLLWSPDTLAVRH